MAIKTRADLKALFANGCIPTQKEFCDLIDSFLNRKDDSLFGEWKPGVAYEEGDVVLYGNSLYILRLDAETGGEESQCSSSSNAPGSPEGSNWQLLDFELQDDDWNVLIPGADGEMVAGVIWQNRNGYINAQKPEWTLRMVKKENSSLDR